MYRKLMQLQKLRKLLQNQRTIGIVCNDVAFSKRDYINQRQSIYLIDEQSKDDKVNNYSVVNKYTTRNFTCGELKLSNVGQRVTLCGWLEYNRMDKFLVLRDAYGESQIIIKEEDDKLQEKVNNIPYESILKVRGSVLARPPDMINRKLPTGDIEVLAEDIEILNKSKETLPFNIREFQKAKESLRMQYRYLDMRFPNMQRNLRVRSKLLMDMRNFLANESDFIEIETPTLFKATPGGAQEFVVPTRFPGLFYSLVQSPQQFKQILMAGACDRYFQVARCYRDEGARSDRQPEFTQMDIELSFTNREGILCLIEDLFNYIWPDFLPQLPLKFKRMTYRDAMEKYGTDQPDTRYDFMFKNCSHLMKDNAYAIVFEDDLNILTKSLKEEFEKLSKQHPKAKFLQIKYHKKDFAEKTKKYLDESASAALAKELHLKQNYVLFLAFGLKEEVLSLLGKVRTTYVEFLQARGHNVIKNEMNVLWILDFPLFETDDDGRLQSVHHPFTAVHPEDEHLLANDPLKARSQAYDLVLNGNEIAGGSIRIHNKAQQEHVLKLLNIPKDSLGHMLDMLESGCPPHGGIAIGVDRLLAMMLNTKSIRDVIAFPKTFEGRDPLSGAPSPLSDSDKELYHIEVTK